MKDETYASESEAFQAVKPRQVVLRSVKGMVKRSRVQVSRSRMIETLDS